MRRVRCAFNAPFGDMQVGFEAVSCWYNVHLCGGSFDVVGCAYVGVPAVMFGRNQVRILQLVRNHFDLIRHIVASTSPGASPTTSAASATSTARRPTTGVSSCTTAAGRPGRALRRRSRSRAARISACPSPSLATVSRSSLKSLSLRMIRGHQIIWRLTTRCRTLFQFGCSADG